MSERTRPVWMWLMGYWLCQPLAVGVVFILWAWMIAGDDRMYGAMEPAEAVSLLTEPGFWVYVLVFSGIFTAAQACYLWPVRRPRVTPGRGRSMRLSVAVAGLMVGLGGLALTVGIVGALDRNLEGVSGLIDGMSVAERWLLLLLMVVLVWVVPSLVLARFCGRGPKERVLGRLANRLLLGTSAEAALLIPLDVMVRRKTECYCSEGPFLGLTLLGMVGFVGAGPAVLLPLFHKRRQGWYRTHCNACGYDMSGGMDSARCPECGTNWKT